MNNQVRQCDPNCLSPERMTEIRGGDGPFVRLAPRENARLSSLIDGSQLNALVTKAAIEEGLERLVGLTEIPDYTDYLPGPIPY